MTEKPNAPGGAPASSLMVLQTADVGGAWDGCRRMDSDSGGAAVLPPSPPSFRATGPPSFTLQATPYWTVDNIRPASAHPGLSIIWEQEAAWTVVLLAPTLLANLRHDTLPLADATGELVWGLWDEPSTSSSSTVRPVLLIRSLRELAPTVPFAILPSLTMPDPLLRHLALALQAMIEGKSTTERLYAEVLSQALVVHFLKRCTDAQGFRAESVGGLSPYKLRRTTSYIEAHLTQELSLVTLAAVGGTSPAHFARSFKHSTGWTPHQYVIMCRMDRAKVLLAETDVSLSEIGLRVGCADQSHFTALFHKHVSMTPKAYRARAKAPAVLSDGCGPSLADA